MDEVTGSDEPYERREGERLAELAATEEAPDEDAALRSLPAVFRWIDTVFKTVMVAMLSVLVVIVAANVFGRFVLNRSLATADELSRFLFIWVIFLGAALAHLHREHIAIDFLAGLLPARMRRPLLVLQELLIGGVLVFLLISAWNVMGNGQGVSPLLRIPLNWVNVSVLVGAVIMLSVTLYRIVALFRPTDSTKEG